MKKIILFIFLLLFFITSSRLTTNFLISNGYDSYNVILFTKTLFKLLLAFISFFLIKKWELTKLAGLEQIKINKWWIILPPLLYLALLNFSDELPNNISMLNILSLILYCIAIGLGEELSLRGVLQSLFINFFGSSKNQVFKAIFITSLIFGLVHLIKFDKGIYGELSQVFFATFIGFCFGGLLVVTKRIYPLIIAHAVIDFVAKTDNLGMPFTIKILEPTSMEVSLINVLIISPVFIYGLYIFKKYYLIKENEH